MRLTPWLFAALAAVAVWLGVLNLRLRRDLQRRLAAEREWLEREQRALAVAEARQRFVAHVGHEVRNLVANILGTLTLAEQKRHALTMPKLARALRASTQSLHDLLSETLDAAQLDAGCFAIRPSRVDLVKLLEDLATEVAPLARQEAVLVGIEGELARSVHWRVDGVRLAQIVRNLVGNALRHAKGSEVRVHARLVADAGPSGWQLCLSVIDHGPGLSAEQQQRLFGEFARVGESQPAGSVGLGLAISRRLARAMHGDLQVCSAPGMGTTFSLWLPVQSPDDEHAAPQPLVTTLC